MAKIFTAHRPKAKDPQPANTAPPRPAERITREQLEQAARQETTEQESAVNEKTAAEPPRPKEIGGPSGPEPTRYGDWERKGICVDF